MARAGCREVKAVPSISSAAHRVSQCVSLHRDGRAPETRSADVPAALMAAPPGTIGVISDAQLLESGGNLVAQPLNGVLPAAASFAKGEYLVTRNIDLYAKRHHARAVQGVGKRPCTIRHRRPADWGRATVAHGCRCAA